ncbi:MAG: TonB-dependent receptor [Acidobacteriota bacterium]|jgi:iron complex outermembrane receptor protein
MAERKRWLAAISLFLCAGLAWGAEGVGQVFGQLALPDGSALAGVTVVLKETGASRTSGADGTFRFDGVPAGSYTLVLSLGDRSIDIAVEVTPRGTAVVQQTLAWEQVAGAGKVVYSAGRQTQRLVDAPAAASTISSEAMLLEAAPWDVGKLAEFSLGADFSWSSLGDLNLNTRGFSSSLNRRVLVLFDGRDASDAMMSAQEWHAIPFVVNDLATIELVRGPGSALYGANAYNGVLNITTKEPRLSLGGDLILAGGELGSALAQARYAASLGGDWYLKVWGGYERRDQTSTSRVSRVEYPGVPTEAAAITPDDVNRVAGGVRLDKYFERGRVLTLEAGTASMEGPVFQTGIGRIHVLDSKRPYARLNFNTGGFNLLAWWDKRDAEQRSLPAGGLLYVDASKWEVEVQGNTRFARERGRVIGGASYRGMEVDSAAPSGQQTIIAAPRSDHSAAVFAQLDYEITPFLHGLVAVRVDDGSLIDRQVSPKASLVYRLTRDQSLRLKFDRAFQTPNYLERFLAIPAGRPVDLSAIESALAPLLGGTSLGFASIPAFALGNQQLDVEKVTSYEIGYTALIGARALLGASYFRSRLEDFVSELRPGVNPAYGPYRPPATLPVAVQQAILAALRQNLPPSVFLAMTNRPDGSPMFAYSYTNFGKVDTQGVEVELVLYPHMDVEMAVAYAYLDYDVKEGVGAAELLPNSPKHRASMSLSYLGRGWRSSVKVRWVDDFRWSAGVFDGMVDSYAVADLALMVRLGGNFWLGAHVLNLRDDDHIETFGGDRGQRRGLLTLGVGF